MNKSKCDQWVVIHETSKIVGGQLIVFKPNLITECECQIMTRCTTGHLYKIKNMLTKQKGS